MAIESVQQIKTKKGISFYWYGIPGFLPLCFAERAISGLFQMFMPDLSSPYSTCLIRQQPHPVRRHCKK
jgi:hypothetical protein